MLTVADASTTFASVESAIRERFSRGVIRVEGGAQAGASVEFGREPVHVGSDLDEDLVLLADGLADHHARIAFSGLFGRTLSVEAHGGSVLIGGKTRLEPGFGIEVSLPVELSVGSARLDVTRRHGFAASTPVKTAVAAVVLGAVVLAAVPWTTGRAFPLAAQRSAGPAIVPARAATAGETASRIRGLVTAAGLADQVTVTSTGADEVGLSGRVDRDALQAWRGVLMRIDAEALPATVSNAVEVTDEAVKPPQIRSVWFGSTPRVMLADGRFLSQGDSTPDGWTVVSIEPGDVVLKGRTHAPVKIAF